MESELNKRAFAFIERIETRKTPDNQPQAQLKGSAAEKGIHDWSDKLQGRGIAIGLYDGERAAIFYEQSDSLTGFFGKTYKEFQSLVAEILLLPMFKDVASDTFMERQLFEWMYQTKQNVQAKESPINHLNEAVGKAVKGYEFYFPVLNLDIRDSFSIGGVDFSYFTKEYLDNYFKHISGETIKMTVEKFDEVFRKDFQGQVVAKAVVTAEHDKAEEVAKKRAGYAVDVLKIMKLAREIPDHFPVFELAFRLSYPMRSTYLTKPVGTEFDYSVNLRFKSTNLSDLDKGFINDALGRGGFRVISDFLVRNIDDELRRFILSGIELLSFSLSIDDLNRRAVVLITVLESLMLKAEKEYNMAEKSKRRISNFLFKDEAEKIKLKAVFDIVYTVRHEMAHKANRIPVDKVALRNAQSYLTVLLIMLTATHSKGQYSDKESLIDAIDNGYCSEG
jgi:hypothetical protein